MSASNFSSLAYQRLFCADENQNSKTSWEVTLSMALREACSLCRPCGALSLCGAEAARSHRGNRIWYGALASRGSVLTHRGRAASDGDIDSRRMLECDDRRA